MAPSRQAWYFVSLIELWILKKKQWPGIRYGEQVFFVDLTVIMTVTVVADCNKEVTHQERPPLLCRKNRLHWFNLMWLLGIQSINILLLIISSFSHVHSLVNIYKELENDIEGFQAPKHGYLMGWAKQGKSKPKQWQHLYYHYHYCYSFLLLFLAILFVTT